VEKIKDFFAKLLDAVRSVIEGQSTLNTTARAGQKAAQQVPVLDDFFNALDNAIDNRQRMLGGDTAQKNSTGGKTGAAMLLLNRTDRGGNSLNILKVVGAYGKDTNPQGLIDNSKILYVGPNKKRTQNWLSVNRIQLPLPSSS